MVRNANSVKKAVRNNRATTFCYSQAALFGSPSSLMARGLAVEGGGLWPACHRLCYGLLIFRIAL